MEHGNGLGLVVAMYSPVIVDYTLANGVETKLSMKTDYPFDDTVTLNAFCGKGMILSLRIPSWPVKPTVSVNGTNEKESPLPGDYLCITILLHVGILIIVANKTSNF